MSEFAVRKKSVCLHFMVKRFLCGCCGGAYTNILFDTFGRLGRKCDGHTQTHTHLKRVHIKCNYSDLYISMNLTSVMYTAQARQQGKRKFLYNRFVYAYILHNCPFAVTYGSFFEHQIIFIYM